jgi:putative ABC transport system permease protein
MSSLLADLRYGIRILRKNPGFTVVAVLTLALGIGANTAIFSVVNSVLLRPLPVKQPERLVLVRDTQPGVDDAPASYPEYLDWKDRAKTFEELGAFFNTTFSLTGSGEPEQLRAMRVSASLFPMLGIAPSVGRGFRTEEERPGGEPVAMISQALWKRRFASSRSALGTKIVLAGSPTTLIGVVPPRFPFGGHPDVWIPLRLDAKSAPRGLHFITVLGRMRPGVEPTQARSEVESVAGALRAEGLTNHGIHLVPLQESVVGETRPALLLLLGAVGLVLLIACANATNLLLARAASRQKEIAVRLAVGASRIRLIRQLLTETLILSVLGGGLGLLIASWGVDFLVSSGPQLPRLDEIRFDGYVLAFTTALSLLTGILFGLAPALQSSSRDLQEFLKEGGWQGGSGAGKRRLRGALVVGEVALSLVLLIGAGLLVRSFAQVLGSKRGFDTSHILAVDLSLPYTGYEEPAQQADFFRRLLDRVSRLDEVEAAGVVSHLPLSGDNTNSGLLIEGRTWLEDEAPLADDRLVSPDYFRALRIPLLKGRSFTEQDDAQAPRVAIINESLARRFFPNQNPIGKRIDMQWKNTGWQEIVGIVGDVRHDGLDLPIMPAVYAPYLQAADSGMTLVVHSRGDPLSVVGAIRAQVYAVDRNQPLTRVRTMQQLVDESVGPRRLSMSLLAVFAALALFLAAIGIYGVLAYSVAQRTHEIGVRMALGARSGDVLRLVVGQGLKLVVAGVILGLAAAVPLSRLLAGMLFGVSVIDPWTFAGIPMVLAAVALAACYLPARRASRIDPLTALRVE